MGQRIAKLLEQYHRLLLALAAAIACVSLPLSRRLQLDWQVAGMFAPGDPLVASYERLQQRFGGNEIVLAVYRDQQLWSKSGDGLRRLEQISDLLAHTEGVEAVLSLAELHRILESLRGPMSLLGLGGPDTVPPLLDPDDELAQAFAQVFEGYTHHVGSDYVAIACLLKSTSAADQASKRGPSDHEATISRLRQVLADLPSPATEGLLAGEPVLVADGFQMVDRDGRRLGITSSLLVSLVLLGCFRSIRWTLIPLVVVHWSLWVTQAILVVLQLELTMVSSTLTAIITVIGVATSTHLLLKFQQMRRTGLSRHAALRETLAVLIVPVAWACVTDAVGFLALLAADVGPVRDFGLMMAVGSLMVLVAIWLLVPGLALIGTWDTDPRTPKLDRIVRLGLRRALSVSLTRRRSALVALTLLAALGLVGCTLIHVETDFTKNFARGSPLVQGYTVIERELGGAGVWDVMLPAPRRMGADYLKQVLELEDQLRLLAVGSAGEQVALTKVLSIADADQASEVGTFLAALPAQARLQGMRSAMPEFTGALLTREPDQTGHRWLRVMLRSREQAPAEAKNQLIAAVQTTVADFTRQESWRKLFRTSPPQAEVTGYHVMLGRLVSSVLKDQWSCFLLATAGIFLAMALATRSVGLALAAMVPNALPILMVLGGMGWLGLPVNMGAAMIAAVSVGLSVDSSIHYLLHYRRRLLAGAPPLRALRSAQENVGLAVVLATVALIAGFLSLSTSEFAPTVVFGTLASLTMLGGLFGNLIVLPILIAPWKP